MTDHPATPTPGALSAERMEEIRARATSCGPMGEDLRLVSDVDVKALLDHITALRASTASGVGDPEFDEAINTSLSFLGEMAAIAAECDRELRAQEFQNCAVTINRLARERAELLAALKQVELADGPGYARGTCAKIARDATAKPTWSAT